MSRTLSLTLSLSPTLPVTLLRQWERGEKKSSIQSSTKRGTLAENPGEETTPIKAHHPEQTSTSPEYTPSFVLSAHITGGGGIGSQSESKVEPPSLSRESRVWSVPNLQVLPPPLTRVVCPEPTGIKR